MSTFTFDGHPVPYVAGQTVAAALIAHGISTWRTTRHGGAPRGVFCGIGSCFDCLVLIDGRPGGRACVVLAQDALDVRTQEGTGHEW